MKFHPSIVIATVLASAHAAEVPEAFAGLLEENTPVRGQIGIVLPPSTIDKYVAKVEQAAKKNVEWFQEFSAQAKPGSPLPYHENLGLTKAEYDEYLALWEKREFKSVEEVALILRKSMGDTWTLTATGSASSLSTLRYDPKTDVFRSPNGELQRIDDIEAPADSILGAWTGREWKFEEETSLGKTKENIAFGRFAGNKYGIIVYRVQEISSEGTSLLDRSLVVRYVLGKAGHLTPSQAQQSR